jgi:vacuolar-type H+-ATPase subunit H
MSLEAIATISEAEERAKKRREEAELEAKRSIAAAEAAGKAAIEAARKKAGDELATLNAKADDKAKADAMDLAASTENKKASLRVKAESRLGQAADLIVERIVNS